MVMLFAVLVLGFIAFLEASVQMDVYGYETVQVRVRVSLVGIHRTWLLQLVRTQRGHRMIVSSRNGLHAVNTGRLRQSRGRQVADMLRRANQARRFLIKHLHLGRLDALVLLRTGDAARSALLTGALRSALAFIPGGREKNVRIRVLPEFFREHSTLQGRCIIRVRLGTLMLTAGMLLLAWLREQHLTESEAV